MAVSPSAPFRPRAWGHVPPAPMDGMRLFLSNMYKHNAITQLQLQTQTQLLTKVQLIYQLKVIYCTT